MKDDIVLLANPDSSIWGFVQDIYHKLLEKGLDLSLVEIKIKRFRDREMKVKITENVREKTCFFVHDSTLEPSEWFTQLALINYAIKYASASKIIDVLPYLYFSRQDRKDESRVAINARVVADIVSLYTDRVITIDLHAPQIQGFYSIPLDNLYSFPVAVEYIFNTYPEMRENLVVMSPDAGGVNRARSFMERFRDKFKRSSYLVFGYKYRPREGEVGEYKLLGDVNEKNVIIVDDIVDSGNTLINAARVLREHGARRVYAYVTHALFTEGFEKVRDHFDRFFVTNTRPLGIQDERLEIINISTLFTEAIYRIATKKSLSGLFV